MNIFINVRGRFFERLRLSYLLYQSGLTLLMFGEVTIIFKDETSKDDELSNNFYVPNDRVEGRGGED